MATPLVINPMEPPRKELPPNSVIGAKLVQLALVTYTDEAGHEVTQLAVIGDNNVNLIDSKIAGFSRTSVTPGPAKSWLIEGIFKLIKKGKKK